MSTLISYHSSGGKRGRCDARCYNARLTICHCVCHGKNHRAGKEQATKNTEELAEQWIALSEGKLPENTKYKVFGKKYFKSEEIRPEP